MKAPEQTLLGRLIPSILILFLFSGCAVIGTYEEVVIHSECGDKAVLAKIDTGARTNSIDLPLAEELCLEETGEIQIVNSANGVAPRTVVEIEFTLGGRRIRTTSNVADRSRLTYKMLVGVRDLDGRFLIRPERMRDEEEEEKN